MTLVMDSSPTSPILPSIPENIILISIGPVILNEEVEIEVLAKPNESVVTLEYAKPSTKISKATELTGRAALSINDKDTFRLSPLTIRLSGSKSKGLRIVTNEYPRLSKKPSPVLES